MTPFLNWLVNFSLMTRAGVDLLCLNAVRLRVECLTSKTTLRVNNPARKEGVESPGPNGELTPRLFMIFVHSIKWTSASLGSDTWLNTSWEEDLYIVSEVRWGSAIALGGCRKRGVPVQPLILSDRSPGLAARRLRKSVKEVVPDVEGSCNVM
jgi:hypothetical protein